MSNPPYIPSRSKSGHGQTTNPTPRYGGELVSLAINSSLSIPFASAGYSPIRTNSTYTGGQVRQHSNLSFSRVYQAGHEVPAYQPQTAYEIFMRVLFNHDVATGTQHTGAGSNYSTEGPSDTLAHRNEQFEQPLQFCYTLDPSATCTEEQVEMLLNGSATVCRYIVKDRNSTVLFPDLMGSLEEEGCGSGVNGSGVGGNGTGGGNGTVGGGSGPSPSTPFEGGASRVVGSGVAALVLGLVMFVLL